MTIQRDGKHSGTASTRTNVPIADLGRYISEAVEGGRWRLGLLTALRGSRNTPSIITLMIDTQTATAVLCDSRLESESNSFPSITPRVPQAHTFERAVFDLFGLRPIGHPRLKNALLHEDWPADFHPLTDAMLRQDGSGPPRTYQFTKVHGDGVFEIPVGPIHAGIIEPGHFRFSCLGEVIQNLEIRLGYTHRGLEEQLARTPWRSARFLAEAASSDTTAGNGLAHALAIEHMLALEIPPAAARLRAVALEIERVASHIGDIGGICSDIGYSGGSAIFSRLRGRTLGLAERLTGTRFQTAFIVPGGVEHGLTEEMRNDMLTETNAIAREFAQVKPLLMDNSEALERMQGIGVVRPALAKEFGLVGPAARACGINYDVRQAMRQVPYETLEWKVAIARQGDVHARVDVRFLETSQSLGLILQLLECRVDDAVLRVTMPSQLPADSMGFGVVEAWRGELIHLIVTNENGDISRYAIKDPSFNNWTGLSIASRGQLVADFPVCNKSFGLSYSGYDL